MELKELIINAVEEKLQGRETFLVEVKASPSKIAVFIDRPDGMKLEECAEISRYLESLPELEQAFQTHELEVSSPGMDEPLKVIQQYKKRLGQEVSVLLKNGIRKNGQLQQASEDEIVLLETTSQKVNGRRLPVTVQVSIALEEVKETRVIFNFNKVLH